MEIFHFKQFDVAQECCAMKIGTDGVLLGAAAPLEEICASHNGQSIAVLDIGTGTGLIALMIAQRLSDAGHADFHIDAVEIDPDAAAQAAENFAASPWAEHLQVHRCSLEEYMKRDNGATYDLILSNPPFYNATLKPEDEARALARHKDALPLNQIMGCAQHRLNPEGELSLVYPMDYDSEVMTAAILANLKPIHICNILTKVGKPCKRRIATFSSLQLERSLEAETLSLRDDSNDYSKAYRELTDPFYVSLK